MITQVEHRLFRDGIYVAGQCCRWFVKGSSQTRIFREVILRRMGCRCPFTFLLDKGLRGETRWIALPISLSDISLSSLEGTGLSSRSADPLDPYSTLPCKSG